MKLVTKANNAIPNQTCNGCQNVYQLIIDDLEIGLFGMDEMQFVCWTCPNCKHDNRHDSLQVYKTQIASRLAAVHPPAYDSLIHG